jgi:hypothetical protein
LRRKLTQLKFNNIGEDYSTDINIYLCWLLCWSGCLNYQDAKEKEFIGHQATAALMKMSYTYNQGPLQEMFEVIMDSAYHFGNEKLVRNLFVFYSE